MPNSHEKWSPVLVRCPGVALNDRQSLAQMLENQFNAFKCDVTSFTRFVLPIVRKVFENKGSLELNVLDSDENTTTATLIEVDLDDAKTVSDEDALTGIIADSIVKALKDRFKDKVDLYLLIVAAPEDSDMSKSTKKAIKIQGTFESQ